MKAGSQVHYALGSDAALLEDLSRRARAAGLDAAGTPPRRKKSSFSPRSIPSAPAAGPKLLFGFDYVWEVYKPADKRKFGYYTLPILWGDQLVARFDSKLDRTTNTFVILGFWLEDEALGKDEAFAEALARGFARFVTFLGARKLDAAAIGEPLLRRRVSSSAEA